MLSVKIWSLPPWGFVLVGGGGRISWGAQRL